MDRLGAAAGHAPPRQVEAFEIGVLDAAHAQVVSKRRRKTDGAAMARQRPQPLGRALHERLRRQQHAGTRGVHRPERHADQPHVVIERQPADADVVGPRHQATRVR